MAVTHLIQAASVAALLTLGAPLLQAGTLYLDFVTDGSIGVPEAGAGDTLTVYHSQAQGSSYTRGDQVQVLKPKDFVDISRGLYELNFSEGCTMTVRVLRGIRNGRYLDFQATPQAIPDFKSMNLKAGSLTFNAGPPAKLTLEFDKDTRTN
jgi:hypothetical protein